MGHPHADKMLQYAKDAKETEKPWKRWETWLEIGKCWETLGYHPAWLEYIHYRRKPTRYTIPIELTKEEVNILGHCAQTGVIYDYERDLFYRMIDSIKEV